MSSLTVQPLAPAATSSSQDLADVVLSVRVYRSGPWRVAEVTGDLDVQSAPLIRELVSAAGPWLALDLRSVTFVDCSGLALLVAGQVDATRSGGTVRLANASPVVRRLIGLLGLEGSLPVYETLEDALTAPVATEAFSTASSARVSDFGLR